MNKLLFIFYVLPLSLFGQTNRYFVSFKDKANTVYSTSNPLQFLSQKSIDRRARENFQLTEEDFPVNANYVQQVKATGAKVFFSSRWFNGVLVQTDGTTIAAVSNLPCVSKVELVAPGSQLQGGRSSVNNKFEQTNATGVLQDQTQLQMIGIDQMNASGFQGEGIDVAVFDGGFNGVNSLAAFNSLYQDSRVKSTFNFVQNVTDVYNGFPHGTWVLSIIAANIPGAFVGGVPKANFFLYQTEDAYSEYRVEEYNWLFAAEKADSLGIDVISSSLGYNQFDDPSMNYTYANMDGKTSVVARAAHKVFERGVVVVTAAGNEGSSSWHFIMSPADADGVLAVGAVNASSTLAPFSSVGPSSDSRIKPDVSAMGAGTSFVSLAGSIATGNGTSLSTPLITCLAVGLRQAFPLASAKEIYLLIINSASQVSHPDNFLGYGIPNFKKALELIEEFEIYPNPVNKNSPLKIDYKYTDGQIVNLVWYNSLGQKIAEYSDTALPSNDPISFDVSLLASGIYYVNVRTNKTNRMQKIIVAN